MHLNLEKTKLEIFKKENIDVESVLAEIELVTNKKIDPKKVILFIDEIQEQPQAFKYLRYFYEERPEIKILAAGSLLEFYLSDKDFLVPVGRINYYYLGPMTFFEFLQALDETVVLEKIRKGPIKDLPASFHNKLNSLVRIFIFVGGMPEAVKTYVESKSLLKVRDVQRSLLETYQDDFVKYTRSSQHQRVSKVFKRAPLLLGQKIKYTMIDPDEKSRDLKTALHLLIKAMIVNPAYYTKASKSPVDAFQNDEIFKIFFIDVGLACASLNLNWQQLESSNEDIPQIWALYEQFCAQHLMYRQSGKCFPSLFYWFRDKGSSKAEVDFIIDSSSNAPLPIEVKSGAGQLKSLHIFMHEKKSDQAIILNSKPYTVEILKYKISYGEKVVAVSYKVVSIPHYLVERVLDLVE